MKILGLTSGKWDDGKEHVNKTTGITNDELNSNINMRRENMTAAG